LIERIERQSLVESEVYCIVTGVFSRILAPLFLAAALALLAFDGRPGGQPARIAQARIDPGRASAASLEALEGLGAGAARRVVRARREGAVIRNAADLAVIPGIGTRRIHRWHGDLDFEEDRR
jgi:Helix-hairpin-helix motif